MPEWRTALRRADSSLPLRLLCALTLLLVFVGPAAPRAAAGASFVVTSNGDDADANPGDGLCQSTVGPCTLRAAIQQANALGAAGCAPTCTITFGLAGSHVIDIATALPLAGCTDPAYCGLKALPVVLVPLSIDGTSGGRPGVELRGQFDPNTPGDWPVGLRLQGGPSTLRGLAIHGFQTDVWFGSDGNRLAGCWLGLDLGGQAGNNVSQIGLSITADPTLTNPVTNLPSGATYSASNNVIGGTTAADRNVISGYGQGTALQILGVGAFPPYPATPADNTTITGNYVGLNTDGDQAIGNYHGIDVDSSANNVIGGTAAGSGNVIAGTTAVDGNAIRIHDVAVAPLATNNRVQGNLIGTNAAGTAALGSQGAGISIGAAGNTIGGTAAGAGNVVAGNQSIGIVITGDSNTVQGNLIGANAAGTAIGNGSYGIWLDQQGSYSVANNVIGGTDPGAGNLIANTFLPPSPPAGLHPGGVALGYPGASIAGAGNRIQGNRIVNNAGLGIDLNGDGPTANDPGDADAGSNTLQNFPVLTSAVSSAAGITVVGTLNSVAGKTYTVEFFANAARADANYQGETFLFRVTNVTTDGGGNAAFTAVSPGGVVVPGGQYITATATDPAGNTSEFSAAVLVQGGATVTPTATAASGGPAGASPTFIPPVRVVDTRPADTAAKIATTGYLPGAGSACQPITAAPLAEGSISRYRLAGCTFGGTTLPADITGVMLNVTSVQNAPSGGFLTVYGADVPDAQRPNASTLNPASAVAANFWTTSVGASGQFQGSIAVYSAGSVRDIAIDVVGYFRPAGAADRTRQTRTATGATAGPGNLRFVTPVRVLDTRPNDAAAGISTTGINADGTPVQPGRLTPTQTRRFALGGRAFGSGANQVTFPNDVAGIIAHVTTVSPTGLGGFVTLLPGDAQGTPGTSTLNPSRPVSFNTTAIGLPADGTFAVFSTEAVDVLVDIVGYYAPSNPATTGALTLVPPQRVLDTRPTEAGGSIVTTGFQPGGQTITAGQLTDPATVRYLLAGKSFGGQPALPADIKGVLINVTLVQGAPTGGFVTVYPGDATTPPTASTLNPSTAVAASFWAAGVPVAPAANAGTVAVTSIGAPRHLIIDLVGYFR